MMKTGTWVMGIVEGERCIYSALLRWEMKSIYQTLSPQQKAHVFGVVSPTLASSTLFQHEGRKRGW